MQDYDDWKLSNAEDEEDAEDAKEQRRIVREHRKLQRHEDQEGER